ncbi:MAG: AraC family transcriptional regulator [Syntrophaceae bacterium]|nr:AraC family transcriptional regulator [Syntrophaceae bacterium]
MSVIFISAIFLSFFIVMLLLTKKQKALTDTILSLFIASIGLQLLGYYLKQAGYWEKYPHLIGITAPIFLFLGPLLYLYCLYSLRSDRSLRRIDYLHFAPGVSAYAYMFNFFFFYTVEQKKLVDSGQIEDFKLFSIVLLIAILTSGLVYSVAAYRLTIRQKQKLKENFSFTEGINLKWLRYCILSIGSVFITAAIVIFLRDSLGIHFSFNVEYIFYMLIITFIFFVGYFGIKQENLFINPPQNSKSKTRDNPNVPKYKNSGMKNEAARQFYSKLLKVMVEEKPYLEPKLTLAELAKELNVSTNSLSQIINQEAGVNFYDFVNKYRVEDFINQAKKNKNFSLLALAFDSGFNSKSSFNQIFKKHTGQTPSEFLAKQVQ